jgi:GT2 family glycosyltransferase
MGRKNKARVLIVILNWNSPRLTLGAMQHACRQAYAPLDIVVIDNGSTDDSLVHLREAVQPPCRLMTLKTNQGFSGGMNVGLREAGRNRFDYAWLLNSDAFPPPECLPALIRFMEKHPAVTIASPRLIGPNGVEEHAGGRVLWSEPDNSWLPASALSGPATWGTWLTGTAPLLRLAGLRQVGGFDDRFYAYWEDVDLCARVLLQGGDLRAVPEASCLHLGNASSGGLLTPFPVFMDIRNSWLFFRTYLPPAARRPAYLRYFARNLSRAGRYGRDGEHRLASVIAGALGATLRGRYGRPIRLDPPAWFRQTLLSHPWRWGQILEAAADRLDGTRGRPRRAPRRPQVASA